MGRFVGIEEFVDRVGEAEALQIASTGDWNTPEGPQLDRDAIAVALSFADAMINGHVLARHPWLDQASADDTPELLKSVALDITRYRLRDLSGDRGEIAQTVERRYRDAVKTLEGIRDAKIELIREGGDSVEDQPVSGVDRARISGEAPRAGAIMEGFR